MCSKQAKPSIVCRQHTAHCLFVAHHGTACGAAGAPKKGHRGSATTAAAASLVIAAKAVPLMHQGLLLLYYIVEACFLQGEPRSFSLLYHQLV